jgi:hypothetical protein
MDNPETPEPSDPFATPQDGYRMIEANRLRLKLQEIKIKARAELNGKIYTPEEISILIKNPKGEK